MRKRAFTLAEVLITLAIIGTIAAITLPSLMMNTQTTELETRFKKTFADLEAFATYFRTQNDVSIPLYASLHGSPAVRDEYLKYQAKASKTSNWTYANAGSVAHDYKWYSLMDQRTTVTSPCDVTGFLQDGGGRIVSFDDAPPRGYNGPRVCIDTNGNKGPNTFGLDVFSFLFTTEGSVIPSGENHASNHHFDEFDGDKSIGNAWQAYTTTGAQHCYNSASGLTCAYYALYNINPKNSSQKYWQDFVAKKQYLK